MVPKLVYANKLELPHRILLRLWSWKRGDRRDRDCDERSQVISVIYTPIPRADSAEEPLPFIRRIPLQDSAFKTRQTIYTSRSPQNKRSAPED